MLCGIIFSVIKMKNKTKTFLICAIVIVFCVVMAIVDGVLMAHYFKKSAVKIALFFALPCIYAIFDKDLKLKELFKIQKSGILKALLPGVGVYVIIVGGYLALRGVFDFSKITGALSNNIGVNKNNFLLVSLYISFVNSLLEEFFFRGFAFLTLKRVSGKGFAYIFSSLAFALYHVAMMTGWFSPVLFALVLSGLFAGGMIFNYLNAKSQSIYPSWLLHMFANFGINTVGFILFNA